MSVAIDKTDGRFGDHGRELGRINPAGMKPAEMPKFIQKIKTGLCNVSNPVRFVAEPKWHHNCQLFSLEG
jgi:hypothetical protein